MKGRPSLEIAGMFAIMTNQWEVPQLGKPIIYLERVAWKA